MVYCISLFILRYSILYCTMLPEFTLYDEPYVILSCDMLLCITTYNTLKTSIVYYIVLYSTILCYNILD